MGAEALRVKHHMPETLTCVIEYVFKCVIKRSTQCHLFYSLSKDYKVLYGSRHGRYDTTYRLSCAVVKLDWQTNAKPKPTVK